MKRTSQKKKPTAKKKVPTRASKAKEGPTKQSKPETQHFFVFGVQEGSKPRGARFQSEQIDKIMDAITALNLTICDAHSPRMIELGAKLPLGRVYARGKAFIPFIRKDLYEQLRDAQFGPSSAPAGKEVPQSEIAHANNPATWAELEVGHEVIAQSSHVEGWWEAHVLAIDAQTITIKWRDYPDEGNVKRNITHIALKHPGPYKLPV